MAELQLHIPKPTCCGAVMNLVSNEVHSTCSIHRMPTPRQCQTHRETKQPRELPRRATPPRANIASREYLVYGRGCVDADLNFVVVNKQAKAKLVKRMLKNSMARKDKGDDGGSGNIDEIRVISTAANSLPPPVSQNNRSSKQRQHHQ